MPTPPDTADPTEVLDHISDGIVCMNAELRYTHVNQPAALFLQRSKEEMLGNRVEDVFPEIVEGPFYEAIIAVRDGKEDEIKVEEYYPPLESWYAARFFPNSSGGVTVLFQDTTRWHLEREALAAGEREKLKIGKDLHDTVCQDLTAIGLLGKALEGRLRKPLPAAADDVAHLIGKINEVTDQARRLAQGLSPLSLEGQTLKETIVSFLEEQTTLFPEIRFGTHFLCKTGDLDRESAIQLYYIAREAFQNAIKYANATAIEIRVTGDRDTIKLSVADNGIGDPDKLSGIRASGLGLRFMQYRARILGGVISIETGLEGKGVAVVCDAPRTPENN